MMYDTSEQGSLEVLEWLESFSEKKRTSLADMMAGGDNVLDAILDEGNADDFEDIEMLDVEEGELVEESSKAELGESSAADVNKVNQESGNKRQRKKKRKNKRKKAGPGPKVMDVNRFVLDVCKRLREKKSYLVYTAVACLGVSALNDIVKEVDAIQACGGQKTADGKRFRNGGGILWNILKTRDPNAYKEIMKKGKEFEKQFKQPCIKQGAVCSSADPVSQSAAIVQNETGTANAAEKSTDECGKMSAIDKHASVHDRLRVPVTYDDILEGEVQNTEPSLT